MEKRAALHLNNMEASALDLEKELEKIADAKVTNTPERMREAAKIVKNAGQVLDKANMDVREYIKFINANKGALKSEKLDQYMLITELLGYPLTKKRQAIQSYFNQMVRWLEYSASHFKKLKKNDMRARRSYDSLLIEVNRSLKQYNTINAQFHKHADDFLKNHPALKKKFKRQYKTMKKEMGWL